MREWQKRFRQRKRILSIEYLKQHPCVDCGNSDVRVLDFDHRGDKSFGIGAAISGGHLSWAKILIEIAKCEVRCANCHRIRHAVENKWYDFPADLFKPKEFKHGSQHSYSYHKCRCNICREAHRLHVKKFRNGPVSSLPSKQEKT
jgi:Zn finger protein HypA/HybF involved in hydrogenase expression